MGSGFQIARSPLSEGELKDLFQSSLSVSSSGDGCASGASPADSRARVSSPGDVSLPVCSLVTVAGVDEQGRGSAVHEITMDTPAPVFLAGECTSTFDLAWELARVGLLPEWGAVLAHRQNSGRGQFRRHWHSPPGNLYVSFRLPDGIASAGDAAALVVGLLLLRSLAGVGFNFLLKWPNDILTPLYQKVGGILLEERGGMLLAGFGLNLVSSPPDDAMRRRDPEQGAVQPAASLFKPGDAGLASPFWMWRQLVKCAFYEHNQYLCNKTLSGIMSDLLPHLAFLGRHIKLVDNDKIIDYGILQGVSSNGGLLIGHSLGTSREHFTGSIIF